MKGILSLASLAVGILLLGFVLFIGSFLDLNIAVIGIVALPIWLLLSWVLSKLQE